jgi:putative transposase
MPAKNSVREYVEGGYYHIYNRGVEKRTIFVDVQDYGVFLSYLKNYLTEKDQSEIEKELENRRLSPAQRDKIWLKLKRANFYEKLSLAAYCLMPNHFHLLLQQTSKHAIKDFMRSLGIRYTMYFNKKYKRVGSLFQGVFKAVLIESDEQLMEVSRYIHKQAISMPCEMLHGTQPCSYEDFSGKRKTEWLKPDTILEYFENTNPKAAYSEFVRSAIEEDRNKKYMIEEE